MITVPESHERIDRQTDRQTDDLLWHNHALSNIAR